mgnify:CR=1 FL=1
MRMIVTGGAGFIGSALARIGVAQGHDVLVVDKLTYAGNRSSLRDIEGSPSFSFKQADICDDEAMAAALRDFQPDAVFHLAAESHVDRSITGAGAFIETNIVGTFRLLQAVRGYWDQLPTEKRDAFRFLHVSTDEVYGSLGAEGLFREDTPYDPRSPYSASKAASDHLVRAYHHTFGLRVTTSNCSNNYGPYHFPEKLIPLCLLNILHGKALPIYGDGQQIRDWLYVEDHATAIWLVLQRGRVGEPQRRVGRREPHGLVQQGPGGRHVGLLEQDHRQRIEPGRIGRLVDQGNTVVVIEHNLDVIKTADWLIDFGPEGGDGGGEIVGVGSPEQIAANPRSWTGRYLADLLKRHEDRRLEARRRA